MIQKSNKNNNNEKNNNINNKKNNNEVSPKTGKDISEKEIIVNERHSRNTKTKDGGISESGALHGFSLDTESEAIYHKKMKDIPSDQRPRELLIKQGAEKLTTPQLLAIVLRTGSQKENALELASRLYLDYPVLEFAKAGVEKLSKNLGIGKAKACQIMASIELGKRLLSYESKPVFNRPSDVAFFLMPELSNLPQEHFKCLYLNRKNRLVYDKTLFIGTSSESLVDPAAIMRSAILNNASSLILSHNHPSGDPTPSRNDLEITKRLTKAGKLLGIDVHDHIIIGDDKFISLAEKGMMPETD